MPDDRPLAEKLAAMAADTSSPAEAAIARAMLENLQGTRARIESRRVLTRDRILTAPSRTTGPRKGVAVRFPSGRWVHMYEDEANWELIEAYQMPWRWEGESTIIYPKSGTTPNRRPLL